MAKKEMAAFSGAQNETICVFNDQAIRAQFASFSPEDMAGKVKLYNAINSPEERLKEHINVPIVMKDVVICVVTLSDKPDDDDDDVNPFVNKERKAFRSIIIDENGVAYTATSTGIYNSLNTLRSVFGGLHFEEGLKVMVKQITVKNGNTLTLSIVQ